MENSIQFIAENLFTMAAPSNTQNDRIYAQADVWQDTTLSANTQQFADEVCQSVRYWGSLIKGKTPDFILPLLWPASSPVDYRLKDKKRSSAAG